MAVKFVYHVTFTDSQDNDVDRLTGSLPKAYSWAAEQYEAALAEARYEAETRHFQPLPTLAQVRAKMKASKYGNYINFNLDELDSEDKKDSEDFSVLFHRRPVF